MSGENDDYSENRFELRYGRGCVMVVKVESIQMIRYGPYVKSGVDEDKKVWVICNKWE